MLQHIRCEKVGKVGVVTLDLPERLNAIDSPMLHSLTRIFFEWSADPSLSVLILQGAGDRAFCAGGDVVQLYRSVKAGELAGAHRFFEVEYALDLSLHRYSKPILCLADRIVMGGGWGLMSGCSHRVVTERTTLAMPEISIGFYPDVGATYYLGHAPDGLGLFCGLTGCRLTGADALEMRLVDAWVPSDGLQALREAVVRHPWEGDSEACHMQLSRILDQHRAKPVASEISPRRAALERLLEVDDIFELDALWRSEATRTQDPWLLKALETYKAGSPTSAAVIFEQMRRGASLEAEAAFDLELRVSQGFLNHPDLAEGIRALLVDKDKRPRWQPASMAEVKNEVIRSHFF